MKKLGKYEIIEELGRGAMGVVYKARDPLIGRLIALKTITAGLADNQELLQRFYREAQSAGQLQHPNIVIVHDLGEENQTPYIAMEFIEGTSLESMIQKKAELPLAKKVEYIAQACRGLAYAHRYGVVHRDIKPANIMVNKDGVIKIVDFGIARVMAASKTQSGLFIGTVAYMSPEQVRGEHVDGRSDIWSVGVMFYELLTYVRPFAADNMAAMMFNIVSQETKPLRELMPDAPVELEAVLQKILEKDTADRFQSMEEVLLDLEPISRRLQSDVVGQLVTQSEQLIQSGDLVKARDLLRQAAMLDTAHAQVKQMLERVNLELKRSKVLPQIQEVLAKAEAFFKEGKLAGAASEAEAALKLDSSFGPAQELMKAIRERAELASKVKDGLQTSKKRLAEGDLTGAEKQVEEVLALAKDDPQVLELKKQIQEEKARREKRKGLSEGLQRARGLWTQQKFNECIELLTALDQEFPNEPEVKSLLSSARADQGEVDKQSRLSEARSLLGEQKFAESLAILDTLLEQAPNDSAVQRLRERVIEERKEHAKRIRLQREQQTLKKLVGDGNFKEAIQRAQTLLEEFPGEFELTQMLEFARSQLEQAEQKRRLDESVRAVRELVQKGEFKQAVADIEKALLLHPGHAELQQLLTTAQAKFKEQDERQKKEFIEKQLRAMNLALERQEYTEAIDLGRKTMALTGENKDVTRVLQMAERERQLRDRGQEAADQFKTAIFRMDEGKFDEAEKILKDVQKTHVFDPRVYKLLDTAREKKPLPPGDETRIGFLGPGGAVMAPPKPGAMASASAAAPPADKTMIGTPEQIAQVLASGAPQVVEPPVAAPPPPPPAAKPPVAEPPPAPPVEKEKKKKPKEKEPVAAPAAPPAKPVEPKSAEPVPVKAAPPAAPPAVEKAPPLPAVKKAPPAVEKAPPVEKPKPPEEKKPVEAKPAAVREKVVPVVKPRKEKPAEEALPVPAISLPPPTEVPFWKKPAVLAAILLSAVLVVGVVIWRPWVKMPTGPTPVEPATGTAPTASVPSGPTPSQIQEQLLNDAKSLFASKKYDAAEQKLKQAQDITGGSHASDINALLNSITKAKNDTAFQALLAREDKLWQTALQAYNQNRVGEAKKGFDQVKKFEGGTRKTDAMEYLNKKIPDLETANGLMTEAQQLAQKKSDKNSLDQAKNKVQQIIAMNGPRTNDAQTLQGTIEKELTELSGSEAAAAREKEINDLKGGAAQDVSREDFAAARDKVGKIRAKGGNPSDVENAIDRAEQSRVNALQSQFNSAKNDANVLRQLQSELQKYSAMGGRVGDAARDIAGKIPAEFTRLEAASRPVPATPTASVPSSPAPASTRTATVTLLSLSPMKWTGPTPSTGQLVNSRYLDAVLKKENASVPTGIVQRAAVGSTVQLELNVSDGGKITGGKVQGGDASVGQAVIETAKASWQFGPPPRVNGKPVTTTVAVKVQF